MNLQGTWKVHSVTMSFAWGQKYGRERAKNQKALYRLPRVSGRLSQFENLTDVASRHLKHERDKQSRDHVFPPFSTFARLQNNPYFCVCFGLKSNHKGSGTGVGNYEWDWRDYD